MNHTPEIVAYVRAKDELSMEMQRAKITVYATAADLKIDHWFIDNRPFSGRIIYPALTELLSYMDNHKVSSVLATSVDRIARSTPSFLSIMQKLRNVNVQFIPVNNPQLFVVPSGESTLPIMCAMAEFFAEQAKPNQRKRGDPRYLRSP